MIHKPVNLDEARLKSLDPGDMIGKTLELPEQLERGMDLGRRLLEHHQLARIDRLNWIGLGGSAIAGDLLRGFGFEIPEITVQRYPRELTGPRMLCSYSGNTIETVRAFEAAPTDSIWLCLASGGRLRELAEDHGKPFLQLPGGYQPRAAVGFTLGAMIAILGELNGLSDDPEFQVPFAELRADAETYRILDAEQNPALREAVQFVNRTPILYAADNVMPAVASRFSAQLAENSKVWSHVAELPELAHNEVEAWEFLGQMEPAPRVYLLGSWKLAGKFPDPRAGISKLLTENGASVKILDPEDMWGKPQTRLAAGLRMMLLLDAISIYLGLLRTANLSEIPMITKLKQATTQPLLKT